MVIVTLVLVVLVGMAALVVDLGNGWQNRRHIITATDAAALAAAQEFAVGNDGCDESSDDAAPAYIDYNFADATMVSCIPGGNTGAGWVTVTAEVDVETWFAGVLGGGDYDTSSASTARWGRTTSAIGLRPIALCGAVPDIAAWLADTTQTASFTVPVERQAGVAECDSGNPAVPGNWGLFDFDGTSGNDTKEWIRYGYDGVVQAGSPTGTCVDEPWACAPPQTGNFLPGLKTEMDAILNLEITLPVINYVVAAGGSHADMHIIGFANVIITEYKRVPANKASITVTFLPGLIEGECCSDNGGPNNAYVVQPCAIDNREVNASCSS